MVSYKPHDLAMSNPSELTDILKRYFGFDAFRPLQAEIIQDALAARDVLAVLPTGAGKSLCFQVPSLVRGGTTLVLSPLIALMKNQVDLLSSVGIPATFLNSSLSSEENRQRRHDLLAGHVRIVYVSPERLLAGHLIEDLKRVSLDLIAVDEAHCISEWGHDFRPEYRQLASLRAAFPEVPVMALTATATQRVRDDIQKALNLRASQPYVASFNRPNLSYRVQLKNKALSQILTFLAARKGQSGIVYCSSRKATERLASSLQQQGIQARPYHAGLEREERSANQEAFIRDECQIICATIAFGMGIDKPNVRFVIHQDLPKNLEGYYQETGRAGRDGLAGDCLLLYSSGDAARQQHFIEEKSSEEEQEIARQQLRQVIHFAESTFCRRASLLQYFGETYPDPNCQSCDNCLEPKETFDGTIPAQKVLSCLYRIYQHSGFSVGVTHVIEVLTGASTEKVRRWGHDSLSTYNIGTEFSRPEWGHLIRQLIRLGLVHQTSGTRSTLELTPLGGAFLKERKTVELIRPPAKPASKSSSARRTGGSQAIDEYDEALFATLRVLRKQLADERNVPAYVIFSDVTLRHIAQKYPLKPDELLSIHGIGAKKLEEHGAAIISQVESHLANHPRLSFAS